ncbi:MAG: hypothetical protein KTR31_12865 [Myxococcales bacterium]|nr:hypothetical protein [Myxococcales bacterium]
MFTLVEDVPSPLTPTPTPTGDWADNGDVLAPIDVATSEILALFSGPGVDKKGKLALGVAKEEPAIVATHGGQAIVNGFLPFDFANDDQDDDAAFDVVELYTNELVYVTDCTP